MSPGMISTLWKSTKIRPSLAPSGPYFAPQAPAPPGTIKESGTITQGATVHCNGDLARHSNIVSTSVSQDLAYI